MVHLLLGLILGSILKKPKLLAFCGIWGIQGICNRAKLINAFEKAHFECRLWA